MRPLSLSLIYKEARAALEVADIIFNFKEAHFMKYSIPKVQKSLISLVRSLSPADVAKSPEKDFSRKRRCTLSDTVLTMAGHVLRKELDDYFLSNSRSLPSVSAFVQQRANTLLSGRCKCV